VQLLREFGSVLHLLCVTFRARRYFDKCSFIYPDTAKYYNGSLSYTHTIYIFDDNYLQTHAHAHTNCRSSAHDAAVQPKRQSSQLTASDSTDNNAQINED